jgi:hypothetical protein
MLLFREELRCGQVSAETPEEAAVWMVAFL